MKTLILFSTHDGQTHKIARHIAQTLSNDTECDIVNIQQVSQIEWTNYNRVMIGAPIRYGHFQPIVAEFVEKNSHQLQQRVSAFFSVNLTARKPEKRTPQTNNYTRNFLARTIWQPDYCKVFAGALRYPRYKWFDRFMIQLIMRMTGGETDTSKEVEYTDWSEVEQFARGFINLPLKS